MTERSGTQRKAYGGHNVTMKGRGALQITGVEDVLGFDEESIVMLTSMGTLSVDGEGLRIVSFNSPQNASAQSDTPVLQASSAQDGAPRRMSLYYDDAERSTEHPFQSGCIFIEGRVNGIFYTDDSEPQQRGGLFGFLKKR